MLSCATRTLKSKQSSAALITCARAIIFISAAESAPAGSAVPVPVGSASAPSHKRTEPQQSCRACGTYLHRLNAPGNNLPVRHVPVPRRSASDQPLDHRALLWPRHDSAVQLAKAEFVAIGRK